MADETLRLQATVVDGFSAPLRNLNNLLGQTAKHGAGKWLKNEWNGVRDSFEKITTGLNTQLSPALSRIGVTSLSVSGAVAGIGVAIKSFATSTRDLNQLSRSIGLGVQQLRELRAVGEHFGMSWDTAQGSLKQFAGNIDQIQRRWGEAYGALRGMNLGGLAEKLVAAPNMQAAIDTALEGLKSIQNPVRRRQVAELLFGTDQWATVASQATPKIRAEIRKMLGEIPAGSAEAAEAFAMNWTKMQLSVERFRNEAIGPLLPQVNELFATLNKPETYAAIKREWDGITAGVRALIKEFQAYRELWRAIGDGDVKGVFQAFRNLDGASGPLARRLAPQAGDEILNKEDRLRQLQSAKEWNDRFPQRPGAASQNERLTREIEELTKEIKRLRENGGATVQQQSFNGGFGAGARIWNASLGGFGPRGFGGPGAPGGGTYDGNGALRGYDEGGRAITGSGVPRISPNAPAPGGPRSLFGEDLPNFGGGASGGRRGRGYANFDRKAPGIMARLQQDFGLTREQAAGIIGNLGHESGAFNHHQEVNPRRGRGGIGWAQWTGPRRRAFEKWAAERRLDPRSDEANYGFLTQGEPKEWNRALDAVRRQRTAAGAMVAFEQTYERAGVKAYRSRQALTDRALALPPPGSATAGAGEGTRPGDAMMGRAFGPGGVAGGAPQMKAEGSVNITLGGGLEKMPARVSMDGLFKDVEISRGRQMEAAN